MGTSRTDYVVLGAKFSYHEIFPKDLSDEGREAKDKEYEQYEDDTYTSEVTCQEPITMIVDGMSSDYVVIGMILAKSFEEDGAGLPMINCLSCYDKQKASLIATLILKIFGIEPPEIGIWVFTHWA